METKLQDVGRMQDVKFGEREKSMKTPDDQPREWNWAGAIDENTDHKR